MNKLKELRLIVKMNERLGVETEQSVFDQILAEEQKEQKQLALQEERKAVFRSTFADLSGQISKLMAEEKQKSAEEQALLDRFANVLSKIDEIKATVKSDEPQVTIIEDQEEGQQVVDVLEGIVELPVPEVIEENSAILAPIEEPSLAKEAAKKIKKKDQPPSMFVQPEPGVTSRDLKEIQRKLQLMEGWVSKISMSGPGGGAVWLADLEDVSYSSMKGAQHGQVLVYNGPLKKWEARTIITTSDTAPVNPYDGDVWINTTDSRTYVWLIENNVGYWMDIAGGPSVTVITTGSVTTSTYTVGVIDNYIGVNYNGNVTITLPATADNGRMLMIKDESGYADFYPIALSGTIDNDPGGAVLQIKNGCVQLIYRNGWRIV